MPTATASVPRLEYLRSLGLLGRAPVLVLVTRPLGRLLYATSHTGVAFDASEPVVPQAQSAYRLALACKVVCVTTGHASVSLHGVVPSNTPHKIPTQ